MQRHFLARSRRFVWIASLILSISGCTTMKQSDTARTGIEQLLVSSSVDRALDAVDYKPMAHAKVFVEQKYLDCVDKNYIVVALHQRLLSHGCTLVDKAEDSDVTVELASGAVGTDRSEFFVGIPDMPIPQTGLAVPRVPFYANNKSMGTAKLSVVAYDTKTRVAVVNNGYALARADHRNMTVMGASFQGGGVKRELDQKTGDLEAYNPINAIATKPSRTSIK